MWISTFFRAVVWLVPGCLLVLSQTICAEDIIVTPSTDGLTELLSKAHDGDHLILKGGVHRGPVLIDKSLSLESMEGAIIDAGRDGTALKVLAPNVTVRGLTIRNSGKRGENFDSGIYVEQGADNVLLENNSLQENLFGIVLHGCKNAHVFRNKITNRTDLWLNDRGNGIHIWNSSGSNIEKNTILSGRDGIYIEISHGNQIRGNHFEGLRFAIHYMYANENEISENISIRNHVGFALMYSKKLKVFRNLSISDLQHGLMLHTTHKSDVAENFIYGTGEKCLFIYTSADNSIHDNRFEQCGVGVHFTGGSENNKFYGNAFLSNEYQVKYTGLKFYEWSWKGRGNYWSDNPAFDLDGNGIADAAYHPNTLVDWVLWRYPLSKLLMASPAFQTLRFVQQQLPTLYPGGAVDSFPLMQPASLPVPLPNGVDLTPAPRDPAQAGSDQRPMM